MAYLSFSLKQLVATVIGTSIFFLLARFFSYHIFGDIFLVLQYAVVGFFAVVFGPICGLVIGLAGHLLVFLSFGNGILWSSVIASAFVGLLSGLLFKPGKVDGGKFDGMDVVRFIIGSLIISIISWGIIKPVGDILFYSFPVSTVFIQGLISGAGKFIVTATVGSVLITAYSKSREKSTSPD